VTQPPPFDVDAFLAQPLTARVATSGPTVRPTWYLWEDGAVWILTGPWATLPARVQADPAIAIVIDVCDLATGLVQQVIARGRAEILPLTSPAAGASSAATLARTRHGGTAASDTTCTTIPPTRAPCGCGSVPIPWLSKT
jgi:hypothetical protein